MTKKKRQTKLLDELEDGPWPSFVTGLKRLADDDGTAHGDMMGVYCYGGGVIPRFSEVAEDYPNSSEFHTLRVQPPAGMHYDTDPLRKMCDIREEHGSGLIALHGQSGDIMFQGRTTENVQKAFDKLVWPICPTTRRAGPRSTITAAAGSRSTSPPISIFDPI